jgi:hypothetical protein
MADFIFERMEMSSPGAGVPETRNAPSEAEARNDGSPVEFQPESGALGPCEAIDEAERDRDPREDL